MSSDGDGQTLRILGGLLIGTGISVALFFTLTAFFGVRIGFVGILLFVGLALYIAGIEMDGDDGK